MTAINGPGDAHSSRMDLYRFVLGCGFRFSSHLIAFTVIVAGAVYVIFDLDYPRFEFVRLDLWTKRFSIFWQI